MLSSFERQSLHTTYRCGDPFAPFVATDFRFNLVFRRLVTGCLPLSACRPGPCPVAPGKPAGEGEQESSKRSLAVAARPPGIASSACSRPGAWCGKLQAPTLAAALAIEWGRPALAVAVASAIWLLIILFRGALSRGRDSFFPAAAAACVVILIGEAFCDGSLALSAVAVVSEIMIGLGLAQSVSRVGTG